MSLIHAGDALDSLVGKSPFFPAGYVPGKSEKKESTTKGRLEFGGYMEIEGHLEVSILDTATGTFAWVALKDSTAPYFVESFDRTLLAISIRQDGLSLKLPLRAVPAELASPSQLQTVNPLAAQPVVVDPRANPTPTPASPMGTASSEGGRIPRQTLRVQPRADNRK